MHSVRLLRPPRRSPSPDRFRTSHLRSANRFSLDREIFQTQRVGENRCWVHHPSTGKSLSLAGCHGLVGQAMAAAAQRRQVRKLIASAILGTNEMVDGKLRFHHRRAKLSAIGPASAKAKVWAKFSAVAGTREKRKAPFPGPFAVAGARLGPISDPPVVVQSLVGWPS